MTLNILLYVENKRYSLVEKLETQAIGWAKVWVRAPFRLTSSISNLNQGLNDGVRSNEGTQCVMTLDQGAQLKSYGGPKTSF